MRTHRLYVLASGMALLALHGLGRAAPQPQEKQPEVIRRGEALTAEQKDAALPIDSLPKALKPGSPPTDIVLKGRVQQVCQSKGCWFTLQQLTQQDTSSREATPSPVVRITSKGYLFFVPKHTAHYVAFVRGTLSRKMLSPAEAKHFADDAAKAGQAGQAGQAAPHVAKVETPKTPTEEWQLEATGVELVAPQGP